jgi:hypothetical protein
MRHPAPIPQSRRRAMAEVRADLNGNRLPVGSPHICARLATR